MSNSSGKAKLNMRSAKRRHRHPAGAAASLIAMLATFPAMAQTYVLRPASDAPFSYSFENNTLTVTGSTNPDIGYPIVATVTNGSGVDPTDLNATFTNDGTFSLSGDNTNQMWFVAFGLQADVSDSQQPSIDAGDVTVSYSGSMDANITASNTSANTSVLGLASGGANGADAGSEKSPGSGAYSAGNGGTVSLTYGGAISLAASVNGAVATTPWAPDVSAVSGLSYGGVGSNPENNGLYPGTGGDGGAVSLTTEAGSTIVLQTSGNIVPSINGITALSEGGESGIFYDTSSGASSFNTAGSGGEVTVIHGGSISTPAGQEDIANLIGISATSIGAEARYPGDDPAPYWDSKFAGTAPTPGGGGAVTVTLESGSSIALSGNTAIGVVALSLAGPTNYAIASGALGGGTVTVTVDENAAITTGSADAAMSIGVAGISSGTAAIIEPFGINELTTGNSGTGGDVTISNAGTIQATGTLSAGIVALSSGGATMLTQASGSSSDASVITNVLGTTGQNGTTAGTGAVTVTNSGSIATEGASAVGILAISTAAGGVALVSGDGTMLGNGADATDGGAGGTVQVTNSGSIVTGSTSGGSNAAIGIVAQSIGGGGGTTGGTGAAHHVGDSGGSGGNGGDVTTTSDGGSITTYQDGAIGILAQSVGGGGGNGANAAGLFVAVGGQGGSGGAGGEVSVEQGWYTDTLSTITTYGDFSHGILAQSVGGGGGNGGYAKSAGVIVSTAIGGAGGSGGAGGEVTLNAGNSAITTAGDQSPGMVLQSIGGGDGNGGAANSYTAGVLFSAAIAVGGNGGDGGNGDAVTGVNGGTISTSGADSIGVIAQSIGGGGGNGGSTLAKSLAVADDPEIPTIDFSTAVGGSGGGGGDGNWVTFRNQMGQIATTGDGSYGILAQSIGGGGGNGGDSSAGSNTVQGTSPTLQLGVSVGGSGGTASSGATVTVENSAGCVQSACDSSGSSSPGTISTAGNDAAAILAQSIGGGGGSGGSGNTTVGSPNLGGTPGTAIGISFALGGSGGGGGDGGTVEVTNSSIDGAAVIQTTGSGSEGVLAQSIGGGGGTGGGGAAAGGGDLVNVNVSVGGSGGDGGTGGSVTVTNEGIIATGATIEVTASDGTTVVGTTGGDSAGILAQSIGGGGGVAGSSDATAAVTGLATAENWINPPATAYVADVSVGGGGGTGGDGGQVAVTNSGTVETLGHRAHGISAQSIGGGGGSGGAVTAAANTVVGDIPQPSKSYSATVSVGGNGGTAGDGGAVTLSNTGSLLTAGYTSIGMLAQSIGGGGGTGAEGSVNNYTSLNIGAGWNGDGGGSGNGGAITISDTSTDASITTLGDDAHGILAQSIGGGGGLGSAGCTNSASASLSGASASVCFGNVALGANTVSWNDSSQFAITMGGKDGTAGSGDTVTITEDGRITTAGNRSMGIVAQSIGGGGGFFGALDDNLGDDLSTSAAMGYNAGGTVSVTLDGSITTSGAGAWGIFAQSIGGGGGFIGDASTVSLMDVSSNQYAGSAGENNGGDISITVSGDITTTGANAHGIVAQSVGGSGGIIATSGSAALFGNADVTTSNGDGGTIEISQSAGTISATGDGSVGIFAQSTSRLEPGLISLAQISVSVAGSVTGDAAGIVLSGGSMDPGLANLITIQSGGSVTTTGGVDGIAIQTSDGYTNLVNDGTITGSVDLGATPGTIANNGTMNLGSTVVTSVGTFTNNGTISVFGDGRIGTTHLSGSKKDTTAGIYNVDIDALQSQQADLLHVFHEVDLIGTIQPMAASLLPGNYEVLTSDILIREDASVAGNLVFDWSAWLSEDSKALFITPSANFNPDSVALNRTQSNLAGYLDAAWTRSDAALAPTFGYLSQIEGASAYQSTLGALSGQTLLAQMQNMVLSSGTILGSALTCPVDATRPDGAGADTCLWASAGGGYANQSTTFNNPGYDLSGYSIRGGARMEITPNWSASGAIGYTSTDVSQGTYSSDGNLFDASLALHRVDGPLQITGALALAYGTFDNSRGVYLPGAGTIAASGSTMTSDSDAYLFGGRLRVAYEMPLSAFYLRPYLDLDLMALNAPSYTESGAGLPLSIGSASDTYLVATPMVEFGGGMRLSEEFMLRGFASAGLSLYSADTVSTSASFLGAAAGDGAFTLSSDIPDVLGQLNLGLELDSSKGVSLRGRYGLQAGDSYVSQTGMLDLKIRF